MSDIADKTKSMEQHAHFNMYRRMPITLIEGKGCRVTDSEGKEYIDALAGIAVNSLGHCHPNVVKAIKEQAEKLIHVSNIYYNVPQSTLATLLTELASLDKVFFCNSGAEANEGAVKLARKYAHKKGKTGKIISMDNCFHGRTLGTVAMGSSKYQQGFDPIPEGFIKIPFNDIHALEQTIANESVIAVFIEPIQGEGGINIADISYLQQVRSLCDQHGILLVFDEIQCGLGRSGKMFAYQYADVLPDILTLAKGLGGGFPVGAVLAKKEVADAFQFGDHGTTFGGNPLACSAAFATLKTIIEDDLLSEVNKKSGYFIEKLHSLAAKHQVIKNIRGKGLMIGVELSVKGKDLVIKLMNKGVLANVTSDYVVRFLPPLTISLEEMDIIIARLDDSLKELASE